MILASQSRGLAGRVVPAATVLLMLASAFPSQAAPAVRYRDQVFESVNVTSGLVYGSARNNLGQIEQLLLDLYQPAGDTATQRGALVFAHGGAFVRGDRNDSKVVRWARFFALRGWVVAAIDYRVRPPGTPGSRTPPQLIVESLTTGSPTIRDGQHDMQAAVRWLRKNAGVYRIASGRIAAAGNSAGAVIALATNYRPEDAGSSGNPGFPSWVTATVSLSGAESPLAIGPLERPVAMFHGMADEVVPFPLAAMTCGTALVMGNVCNLHPYPTGHSLDEFGAQALEAAAAFLYEYVIRHPVRGRLPA